MMVSSFNPSQISQKIIGLLNLLDSSFDFSALSDVEISDISDDSRQVEFGALFIARAGNDVHGDGFINDAIKNGAAAILRQSLVGDKNVTEIKWLTTAINKSIPEISISFSNQDISKIAVAFYQDSSKKIQITGITGTNGKTSCAYILAHLINLKNKCGFIGTIGLGDINSLIETNNTTQGTIENQKIIAQMYGNGTKQLVMEVSSHALTQHRVDGVDINCAVFTNLSHDHLDYHQTFEQYGAAKLNLFTVKSLEHAVINIDDNFSQNILKVLSKNVNVITYGIDNITADIVAEITEFKINSTLVKLKTKQETIEVNVPLLGKFNISNLLAVCGVLMAQGLSLLDISNVIPEIQAVKGRMQCIGGSSELPLVVVDYAHTPDALGNVLDTLRKHCNGKLWCIFGCGGDRDKSKRAIMGKIVSTLADQVVITNDNPRTEDPVAIANDISKGIVNEKITTILLDRKEAIQSTINQAGKTDIILIAGKGHENYQIIDNIKYHFDDVKISLDTLNTVGMK